jgi:DNA-binding FadR family transcriptional regulator
MTRPFQLDTAGKKIHSALAQDIGSRILRGDFKPGSSLPNEAHWCRVFKVSRSAVREAMKMLIAKGLVVSRPKIGSRVEPRERWNLLDRDVLAWYGSVPDQKRFLMSVQQMRYIFEPEAAALAARHRTQGQLVEIETACREMGEAASLETRTSADVRFHLAILRAAGNEFLVPFGFLIESGLAHVFEHTTRHIVDVREAQSLHEKIARAIREKRPRVACNTVKLLLANTDGVILRSFSPSRRAKPRGAELKLPL